MATQAAANQATYDNQKRLFMADIVIFFALIMILFDKHPFATEQKSSKVNKDKIKQK